MKRISLYSQNFLRSPRFVKELLGNTNITTNDTVYDIGAGTGVISSVLAKHCRSVVAVELDPRMAAKLRINMLPYPNVLVYQTDFLLIPTPSTPYKVFANIPFSLSAAIVRKLTQCSQPPETAYLIVQKEFAYKLLPKSNGYTNLLALKLGVEFDIQIRKYLRQSDFLPQPKVLPVLLEIRRRTQPLIPVNQNDAFCAFITSAYGHKRTLKKALEGRISGRQFSKFTLAEKMLLNARPSQLHLMQWIRLFKLTNS